MIKPANEKMVALEKVAKKSLVDIAPKAVLPTVLVPPAPRTYASLTAPPMAMKTVRKRIENAGSMQLEEPL